MSTGAASSPARTVPPTGAVEMKARAGVGGALLVALLCGALVTGSPSGQASTGTPPETVSGSGRATDLRAVTDLAGNTTAVWTDESSFPPKVTTAFRPDGGPWSEPRALAPTGWTTRPDLVVDPVGNVTVAWVATDRRLPGPGPSIEANWIQSVTRSPDGTWGAPVDISTRSSAITGPRLAVDPEGVVTAAWSSAGVVMAAQRAGGAPWGEASPVSPGAEPAVEGPDIAVDAQGVVTILWSEATGAGRQVRSAVKAREGTWTESVPVSEPHDALGPVELAVDGAGTATAAWATDEGAMVSSRPAGGTWRLPLALAGDPATSVALATDVAGNLWTMWTAVEGTRRHVRVAARGLDGTWSPPSDLAITSDVTTPPAIGVGAGGHVIAVWTGRVGTSDVITAARTEGGAAWSPPVDVAVGLAPVDDVRVVVDRVGSGAALWTEPSSGSDRVVQSGALDVSAPVVRGMAVPVSGTVDTPMPFSVTAYDSWSPIASYTWTFGDGGMADGAGATHTYATPGRHSVTVAVTDRAGNVTRMSRTTDVSVLPQAPPRTISFRLTKRRVHLVGGPARRLTALKIRLTERAVVTIVLRSKHRHVVAGERRHLRAVARKRLPAGLSTLAIRNRTYGVRLRPDTYAITGTPRNDAGTGARARARLVVVGTRLP